MARGIPVRLDHGGFAELLKSSDMQQVVRETVDEVANNARSQGLTVSGGGPLPIEVASYITDRAAGSVTAAHASGLGMEARYGVLTKAAAAAGLEVTER